MPESDTPYIDYYPDGWTEHLHEEAYVEWVYGDDPAILVRLSGTMESDRYVIAPITGVNSRGEEFMTRTLSTGPAEQAFDVAITLVYAINGAIGRIKGEAEFIGGVDR